MAYVILTQNDVSQWNDDRERFHFPVKYRSLITEGSHIIYYKGIMRNPVYRDSRLSPTAHYFGCATVGRCYPDPESPKKKRYCTILDFKEFQVPVSIKKPNGEYYEEIPATRQNNWWRDGARPATETAYNAILQAAGELYPMATGTAEGLASYAAEGGSRVVYGTQYERDPQNRAEAIRIHGLSCQVCGVNFEAVYGAHGRGFIHVHHKKPLHATGPTQVNPRTDLAVVCPNCHAMIHRNRSKTLSLEELKALRRPQEPH